MSDLDDGLVNILSGLPDPDGGISAGDMEYALDAIKQAFTDAGYVKFPQGIQESKLMDATDVRMTGQEWYDRFKAELEPLELRDMEDEVLRAAKRAANINEQETN